MMQARRCDCDKGTLVLMHGGGVIAFIEVCISATDVL